MARESAEVTRPDKDIHTMYARGRENIYIFPIYYIYIRECDHARTNCVNCPKGNTIVAMDFASIDNP